MAGARHGDATTEGGLMEALPCEKSLASMRRLVTTI